MADPGHHCPDNFRGADRLASAVEHCGIKVVFSLSGNQIMPIYDAFNDISTRIVHVRHEAAAVFMAEAYARVSGAVGVALVTAAPGFGNALGALYSASMSEVPLILLSGDSPLGQDDQGAFQQFDQVAAASPFVKASFRLSFDDDAARVFKDAASISEDGVPGPVHIALPFDVIESKMDSRSLPAVAADNASRAVNRLDPAADQLMRISAVLAAAERPLVLAGPHLFRAPRQAKHAMLSAALDAPVVILDSPRGLHDPAQGALRELLLAADCVLYLGKPVDFTSGFGSDTVIRAKTILVVSEYAETLLHAGKVFTDRQLLSMQANAVATVQHLIGRSENSGVSKDRPENRTDWNRYAVAALEHRQLADSSDAAAYSKRIVDAIAAGLGQHPEAILICDGGEFGQWAQAFVRAGVRITNGPSGAIGASLPYAIGAKLARPDVPVIAIMGDGTAGFHLAEFETAARESLAITVLIGNDSRWNAEHLIQLENYGTDRTIACELSPETRYDLAARGLGCDGVLARDVSRLQAAVRNGLGASRPTCINVIMPGVAAPKYRSFEFADMA